MGMDTTVNISIFLPRAGTPTRNWLLILLFRLHLQKEFNRTVRTNFIQ